MDDLQEVLLNMNYKLDLINKKLDDLKSNNQIITDSGLGYNMDTFGNFICKDIEPIKSPYEIKSGYDYLRKLKYDY
jgi:hypothetical protein